MKQIKNLFLTMALSLGAFTLTLTSCEPDPCDPSQIVCANGGTCLNGVCTCPSGFEGVTCSTQSLSKLLGTGNTSQIYNFSDTGSGTSVCGGVPPFTGTFTMSRSVADTNKVVLTNFGGFGAATSVTGTVSGNILTIPSQAITGAATITISGTGNYNSTSHALTGSYLSNDGTNTCTYNFVWTKP